MESLAAVDLGSNSFHMVIARLDGDALQIVDRIREPVRLAAGLQDDGSLDEASQARALEALARFGQRLRDFGADQVRVVGTNTLRKAKNSRPFLHAASDALGHHIEIIPGREEARLIYLGVSHGVAGAPARRLVVDIGGGSTECIIGDSFDAVAVHSLYMASAVESVGQNTRLGKSDRRLGDDPRGRSDPERSRLGARHHHR